MTQKDEARHTPVMNFRIPREIQDQAKAIAAERGETVTAVVLAALEAYIKKNRKK